MVKMVSSWLFVAASLVLLDCSLALNNGLALTPPMGWMSWERFRCNVDCDTDPLNCINENLFKQMAEEMVLKGFKDVGYEYIIIDDCWMSMERDENGKLQPDPIRFPSGIKALSDYVHSLGLKFGIYEDYGNFTCGGYPGILGHLETDANTFAEWGTDYIKIDGCYVDLDMMPEGYPQFGAYLNATGRPIVYSCSWPAYWTETPQVPDYPAIAENCNLWRNWGDIQDSWTDVLDIIDYYGDNQDVFAQYAGPGNWNDPDMLIIGNYALTIDESRVQMALWAVLAAPLIMSNDLRTIRPEFIEILQNRNVIKINQDPIGHQGRRLYHNNRTMIDIYVKNITPTYFGNTSAAVAVMYRGTYGTPVEVSFQPEQLGLTHEGGYIVSEVFDGAPLGTFLPDQTIKVRVNPVGVQLLRLDVKPTRYFPNGLSERSHQQQQQQEKKKQKGQMKHEEEKRKEEIWAKDLGLTGWKSDDTCDQ
jgi:alpha-N-acetylgalactosaminidase